MKPASLLRRRWSWPWRSRRQPHTLAPVEAYRRWAGTYGDEPNALQQIEAEALERVMPRLSGRRVLDLGCGKARGAVRALDAGAVVATAADRTLAMLVSAKRARHHKLRRLAAATHPLPFGGEQFDVVLCTLVLGHVADLGDALGAMARVLVSGGDLVISDFHPEATRRGWQRTFRDVTGATQTIEQHLHSLDTYRRTLHRLGLVIEALEEASWQGKPVVFALRAHKHDRVKLSL